MRCVVASFVWGTYVLGQHRIGQQPGRREQPRIRSTHPPRASRRYAAGSQRGRARRSGQGRSVWRSQTSEQHAVAPAPEDDEEATAIARRLADEAACNCASAFSTVGCGRWKRSAAGSASVASAFASWRRMPCANCDSRRAPSACVTISSSCGFDVARRPFNRNQVSRTALALSSA